MHSHTTHTNTPTHTHWWDITRFSAWKVDSLDWIPWRIVQSLNSRFQNIRASSLSHTANTHTHTHTHVYIQRERDTRTRARAHTLLSLLSLSVRDVFSITRPPIKCFKRSFKLWQSVFQLGTLPNGTNRKDFLAALTNKCPSSLDLKWGDFSLTCRQWR